jgi:O-antigen/teichoic acid export membrane protein
MSVAQRLLRRRLALNTSLSLLWQLIRVGAQALWLLIVARKLGAGGYGIFAGMAGLATFVGAFSGLGLGLLLLRNVARDPAQLGAFWHKGLRWTLGSGALLALGFVGFAWTMERSGLGWGALLAIGASEVVLFPVVSFCTFAFNANERTGFAAGLPALTAIARLIGALIFLWSSLPPTLGTYSAIHLGATLVAVITCLAVTLRTLRPGPTEGGVTQRELFDGLGYSSVWAVTNALTSLDKTLVLNYAGGTIAGLYSAAYRMTMIFALPIDALAMSSLPRVFRLGNNTPAIRRLIALIFVTSVGFSAVAAMALYFAASIIPWLLGQSFTDAAVAAKMFVWLLPAYALRLLGGNTLLGLDGQWLRLAIELLGLIFLCLAARIMLSHGGLDAAARMIVSTEGTLAVTTWCAVAWRLRRQ